MAAGEAASSCMPAGLRRDLVEGTCPENTIGLLGLLNRRISQEA